MDAYIKSLILGKFESQDKFNQNTIDIIQDLKAIIESQDKQIQAIARAVGSLIAESKEVSHDHVSN